MVDRWASECFQYKHYTNNSAAENPYSCRTCESDFRLVSALLEHIENGACDSDNPVALDKMKRYVEKRVAQHIASDSSSM